MDYVRIGLVAKPQGIRGEIKVNNLSDRLDRFLDLDHVFAEDRGHYTEYKVKGARLGDGCAFLFLEHIYSRDEAETLRGQYVCVERENAIELPEGRYFIFDLEGCEVFTEQGQNIGRLTEVLQPGANDVYVVSDGKNEVLVPAVKSFVLSVDIANKKIVVSSKILEEVEIRED